VTRNLIGFHGRPPIQAGEFYWKVYTDRWGLQDVNNQKWERVGHKIGPLRYSMQSSRTTLSSLSNPFKIPFTKGQQQGITMNGGDVTKFEIIYLPFLLGTLL
jgi:hypothetical protein